MFLCATAHLRDFGHVLYKSNRTRVVITTNFHVFFTVFFVFEDFETVFDERPLCGQPRPAVAAPAKKRGEQQLVKVFFPWPVPSWENEGKR